MTDEEIIRLVKQGKVDKFSLLVERYQQKIFGLCYRMLGNQHDGEDAAQEVFFKAYQKLATFNQTAKFSTWLYRIGVNTCYDYLRKNKNKKEEIELTSVEMKEYGPEEKYQEKEKVEEIKRAVGKLSQEQQVIVHLHLFGDLSYEAIAEILKISPEAAKMRYYRARASLQKELSGDQRKVVSS